ncbi:MAG: radical SAM protein [Candidatus Methanoperedens sp.]
MGLGYIAAVIENMGVNVRILDCLIRGWDHEERIDDLLIKVGLSDEEIEHYICEYKPDIVGINCQFSRQYKIYHHLLALVKRIHPECITIAGGPHVTVCPTEILKDQNCDFILIGEGEESFKTLIQALIQGTDLKSIDGLGWKSEGKLIQNEKSKWIADLDSIPFPAYHIMELERYFGLSASHGMRHKKRFSPIITSRGCPAKCTFCSAYKVWGNRYRLRSVDNVIEEMRLLRDRYGVEELMFEDDNVTANPKRAKELFSRMIEEGFNFIWDTPNGVGVWSMDEEMLDIMKQSGCIKLNFPVESGSQFVLNNIIHKPLKLNKVVGLTTYCRKISLDYGMFLVIGMPGEKLTDMWTSIRFAAYCRCYSPHISVATPYPGTKLFEECMQKGFFVHEFTLDDLFIRSFIIRTPEWDEHDLRRILLKAYIYLNIRSMMDNPGALLTRIIEKLRNPISILKYLKSTL